MIGHQWATLIKGNPWSLEYHLERRLINKPIKSGIAQNFRVLLLPKKREEFRGYVGEVQFLDLKPIQLAVVWNNLCINNKLKGTNERNCNAFCMFSTNRTPQRCKDYHIPCNEAADMALEKVRLLPLT